MKFVTNLSKGILGTPDSTELWDEIIAHIPDEVLLKPNVRILNVASGYCTEAVIIAKRMLALGISKEAVQQSIYLIDKYHVFTNYAKAKYGFTNVITADFLQWESDMKFDVVIGNPPYQDEDKNPLYYKFHNHAVLELLEINGMLAFITPDAIAVSLETGIIKGCHKVEQREICLINISTNIKTKYFKDVGINNFCYYIIKNNPKLTVSYPIITIDGMQHTTINPLKPLIYNALVDSILDKCFKFDSNFYTGSWNTAGTAATRTEAGLDLVALRIDKNRKLETYNVEWTKHHKYYGIPKIFITGFGDKAIVAYNHKLICATEKFLYTVPTNNDIESERLLALLDCNLKKFLTNIIKARGPYIDFVRHFKGVTLSKEWTDAELYAHFNLTQEEIDYIEANVK